MTQVKEIQADTMYSTTGGTRFPPAGPLLNRR